jgi:hypothetical protein
VTTQTTAPAKLTPTPTRAATVKPAPDPVKATPVSAPAKPVAAPAKPVAAPAKHAVKIPTKPDSVSAPSPAKPVVKMPTMPISKPAPAVAQAVEEAIEEAEIGDEYEFPSVDPESFVCFGTAEPGHPECEKCSFREPCAKKTDEKKAGM